jgi:hypothetical protein
MLRLLFATRIARQNYAAVFAKRGFMGLRFPCADKGTHQASGNLTNIMGETQMGKYGAGTSAMRLLTIALLLLVGSTVIIGYGNYLALAH